MKRIKWGEEKYPGIYSPISNKENEKLVAEHSSWGLANAVSTLFKILKDRDKRIAELEQENDRLLVEINASIDFNKSINESLATLKEKMLKIQRGK